MNAITLRKRFVHPCRRVLPEVNDIVVKCVQPCFSMYIYMYMEKQGWTHLTTISFTSGSTRLHGCTNLFLSVIAFMYEEGHTWDLCFASMGLPPHLNT